jgi:Ni,Fe-hydrogenase I small subunit
VSSTWRIDRDLSELKEIVNGRFGVTGQVIDKTPRISHEVFPGETCKLRIAAKRGDEIAAWLAACECNTNIESFVILDDDSDMGELLNRTVLTDFKEGLTEADADRALEMLR